MSKNESSSKFISAVQWSSAILPFLDEGHTLNLPFCGFSMYPLLVGGRDQVLIESVSKRKPKRGDIVLYRREDGTHVLHRIHHIRHNTYFMLGDAQNWIEGPLEEKDILAVVSKIIRKGKTIECSRFDYRIITGLWLFLRPVRPLLLRTVLRKSIVMKVMNSLLKGKLT